MLISTRLQVNVNRKGLKLPISIPFITSGSVTNVAGTLKANYNYGSSSGTLENNPPPYVESASITNTGSGQEGDTFTCTHTIISPSKYTTSATYQWYRKNEDGLAREIISGATSQSYVATSAEVGKILECLITPHQTATAPANGNPTGEVFSVEDDIVISAAAVARSLLYTVQIDLRNNTTPVLNGWTTMNATDSDNGLFVTLTDTLGTARGTMTNATNWGTAYDADAAAGTGELVQEAILGYHFSGANNPNVVKKVFNMTDPNVYIDVEFTSVPPTTVTTVFNTFFKANHYPSDVQTDTAEVTVVPFNYRQAQANILLANEVRPRQSDGVWEFIGREPSTNDIYVNTIILRVYSAPRV